MSDYVASDNYRELNAFHDRINAYAKLTGFHDFFQGDNSA